LEKMKGNNQRVTWGNENVAKRHVKVKYGKISDGEGPVRV